MLFTIDRQPGSGFSPRMCNLYSIARSQEATRRLFRVKRDFAGNLPSLPAVYPDTVAPVVRTATDGERELLMMRWCFPPPPNFGTAPGTNVRNLKSPYWRSWLKPEWRCLVPATSFCEWTDNRPKMPHWFALDETRPLFAFAGIWRLISRFGDTAYFEARNRARRSAVVSTSRIMTRFSPPRWRIAGYCSPSCAC